MLFLLAHILVLFKIGSLLTIQFCQITFVVFFCAIAKPYELLSGSFRLSQSQKPTQKVSGLRRETTLKVWQTFRLFMHISFRADTLSCFLADEAAAVYSRLSGTVHSRIGRLHRGQKLWSASEAQVLARIRSSSLV